jgi:hypothetical protein
MMTLDQEYEDIVRHALAAAAESIEPAGDGLQRIRHRLHSPRPASSTAAALTGWFRLFAIRFSVRLEPAAETGRSAVGRVRHLLSGPARPPARRAAHGRLSPGAAWLRPVLAVAAVVGIVAVGAVTLHAAQRTIIRPTNSVTSPGGQARGSGGAVAAASMGPWTPPLGVASTQPTDSSLSDNGVTALPAVACTPTPTPATRKATPKATVTPTPSVTPTGSATATPTPTPTATGSPSVSPTPSGTSGSGSPGSTSSTAAATTMSLVTSGATGQPVTRCGSSAAATATPSQSTTAATS